MALRTLYLIFLSFFVDNVIFTVPSFLQFQECRKRRKFIMICILSPNITLDDIQYPDMREVLQNVTYLQWPPKQTRSGSSEPMSRKEFKDFWQKLYTNIVMGNSKGYPYFSIVSPNRNLPV